FREKYEERYLHAVNDSISMTFDNLPFVDGNRYSGSGVRAGLYPYVDGKRLTYTSLSYSEQGSGASVTFYGTAAGDFTVAMTEDGIRFTAQSDFELKNESKGGDDEPRKRADGSILRLNYRGFDYTVQVGAGTLADENTFRSEDGVLVLELDR
ncbi:MAG: hypothetical protein J5585_03200, partial [Clostridia bacterium]|nr:hypothetical protein [Clostridia bacterium]